MNYGGGSGFEIEYNVADCQGGWAILKTDTGQVVGCYTSEAEAKKHMSEISTPITDILGDEVRTTKTPEEIKDDSVKKTYAAESFWAGFFSPTTVVMGPNTGSEEQDSGWKSTYNSPPQKDGTETTGYGNSSAGTNPK